MNYDPLAHQIPHPSRRQSLIIFSRSMELAILDIITNGIVQLVVFCNWFLTKKIIFV